jgi:hypothetical protein
MSRLSISLLVLLAFGCTGSDISQDPPIQTTDAAPGTVDASEDTPDATPGAADAAEAIDGAPPSRAQLFCDQYEALCGYDEANNRYDDESHCLTTFEGLEADRQDCVEAELDSLENDNNLNRCRSAMGNPPCN